MLTFLDALVGPLAGPECRRALARGWVILVRSLAACAVLAVALVAVWWWWLINDVDPGHQPNLELRTGLAIVEGMLLTIALVLAPAVLAGSIAGEKEQGALGLLLTTTVSSREIVTGRLLGKFGQVGMILLAGLPAVVLLGVLADLGSSVVVPLLVLPAAVALGGAGLAALAAVLSRRGRDALLAVYLVDFLFLLTPLIATTTAPQFAWLDGLAILNPYSCLDDLVFRESTLSAWLGSLAWIGMGMFGVVVASTRLRPAVQGVLGGESSSKRSRRPFWVPPVDERWPMLWKELFIERVGTLGKFGNWFGRVLVAALLGGSGVLTGLILWGVLEGADIAWADWARDQMRTWIGETRSLLGYLIEWAIGLRAAVSISSERERGTWDALMTSPLEPGEIVRGKLWGSLHALRWVVLSGYVAWTLATAVGAIPFWSGIQLGAHVLIVSAFMAAVGVRASLECQTATRAIAITLGIWLGALVVFMGVSGVVVALFYLIANIIWITLYQLGLASPITAFWVPVPLGVVAPVLLNLTYVLATIVIIADSRLRFDRLAGRITGGAVAVAFDTFLHGRPEAPVLLAESSRNMPNPAESDPRPVVEGVTTMEAAAPPRGG